MISAADFDDVLLLAGDTGDTHGSHDGLRAAAQHAEHLHIWHVLVNLLGNQKLRLVEQAGDGTAVSQKFNGRFPHRPVIAA